MHFSAGTSSRGEGRAKQFEMQRQRASESTFVVTYLLLESAQIFGLPNATAVSNQKMTDVADEKLTRQQIQKRQQLKDDLQRKKAFGRRLTAAAIAAKPTFDAIRKELGVDVRGGKIGAFLQVYDLKHDGPVPCPDTAKRWFAGERIPRPIYRIDLCNLLNVTWDHLISNDEEVKGVKKLEVRGDSQTYPLVVEGEAGLIEVAAGQNLKAYSHQPATLRLSPKVNDLPAVLSKFVSNVVSSINEMAIAYSEDKTPDKSRAFSEPTED